MECEFDQQKDETNRSKHGVSLNFARELDWDAMLVVEDDTGDYDEERWIGIAPKGERLYTTVFTVRGEDRMRVISLRPATNSEIRRYEQQGKKQSEVRPKHRRRGKSDKGRRKGRS